MKTAEEKAKEYASKECPIIISGVMQTLTIDEWSELAQRDYLAGYNEAKKETNTWVSVRYASPEYFESIYGVNMPYEQRYACHYDGDDFVGNETGETIEITHWMYAPEAPEE